MIAKIALVAAGGALGAVMRFLVVHAFGRMTGFPLGTLAVNVAGSFAMGVLAVVLMERAGGAGRLAPFLMTGLLGGFTTFSAFSLDTLALVERGRGAEAALYVALSAGLSVGALWAGLLLARAAMPGAGS